MFDTPATPAPISAQTQTGKQPVSDAALGVEDLEFSTQRIAPTTPTKEIVETANAKASNAEPFSVDQFAAEVDSNSGASKSDDEHRFDFSPGELGHAQRFVDYWGETTRYDLDRDCWMTWKQTHWTTDIKDSEVINQMSIVATKIIDVEVPALRADIQEEGDFYSRKAKRVYQEGLKLHNNGTITSSLALAKVQPVLKTRTRQYDADPMLFNCLSGVINLKTGTIGSHRPEDMHSRVTPIALAPEGTECPRWMKFLNEIMCGDSELVSYVQRVVGYLMTGSVREQCFFILYGDGANGKSTFINVIFHIIAGYAHNVDIRTFEDIDRGNSPRNDLAQLVGMRFVVSPEWKLGQALDEAILKTISGGDLVSARFLNKEMFQFNPVCKVVLASNHKPIVKGTDHGIWRRMRLVPFLARLDESQKIEDLDDLLIAEEGPAILQWAVQGAKIWASQGLRTPSTICEATTEYRGSQDWFLTFLEERCDVEASASVASQAIYNDYKTWCITAGIRFPVKQTAFNERLLSKQFHKKVTKAANLWMGLKLKTGAQSAGPHFVHANTNFSVDSMTAQRDSNHESIVGDLNFGV